MSKPVPRLSILAPLAAGQSVALAGKPAHYLTHVLRLREGATVQLFNRTHGEWQAEIQSVSKREVVLAVQAQTRPPGVPVGLTVCFAPIKGGRLETIIEKATELGASVLQPVITARTIVDRVNLERAEAIAREAAEQCERTDWPEIRGPVKFERFLGDWPADVPLIYGDESGASGSIGALISPSSNGGRLGGGPTLGHTQRDALAVNGGEGSHKNNGESSVWGGPPPNLPPMGGGTAGGSSAFEVTPHHWAILTGPEGGFTPEEFTLLSRHPAAKGVGLGPRILRADTAVITLCALTLAAWGDWDHAPRFTGEH